MMKKILVVMTSHLIDVKLGRYAWYASHYESFEAEKEDRE